MLLETCIRLVHGFDQWAVERRDLLLPASSGWSSIVACLLLLLLLLFPKNWRSCSSADLRVCWEDCSTAFCTSSKSSTPRAVSADSAAASAAAAAAAAAASADALWCEVLLLLTGLADTGLTTSSNRRHTRAQPARQGCFSPLLSGRCLSRWKRYQYTTVITDAGGAPSRGGGRNPPLLLLVARLYMLRITK